MTARLFPGSFEKVLSGRASGILLHLTSLPGPYGIGEIGPDTLRWLDALAEMKQTLWQTLPLGPTGFADSPYQSSSTFAGNAMLVGLEWLREEGLLDAAELAAFPPLDSASVDFGRVIPERRALLELAARRFPERAAAGVQDDAAAFFARRASWLDDYALFAAIKDEQQGRAWVEWDAPVRDRDPAALAAAKARHREAIETAKILQFLFDRQWRRVRGAARQRGIRLVGDLAIYVAHDSADVWANRGLFELDEAGHPTVVAGVPPDYFSETGQRWGNPIYRWKRHAAEDYGWWAARFRRALDWFDVVRIDHFRGFAGYWEIPASEPTAVNGRWVDGPGAALFASVERALGGLPFIAEDLGLITADVEALRESLGIPGMRVVQFAFGAEAEDCPHWPSRFVENCVAVTGTNDNDTLVGWLATLFADGSLSEEQIEVVDRCAAMERLARDGDEVHWRFIRALLESRANNVILPLQDVLGLGSEARMNHPGKSEGNWRWRFRWEELTPEIRRRLADLTAAARRG